MLVHAPVAVYGPAWFGVQGLLAGWSLLVVRGIGRHVAYGAVCTIAAVLMWTFTGDVLGTVYVTMITAVTGLTVFGLSRIRSLTHGLEGTRSQLAALSVSRERLRFAQELQGVEDDQISRVQVTSEQVLRLVHRWGTEPATTKLTEVVAISRGALRTPDRSVPEPAAALSQQSRRR